MKATLTTLQEMQSELSLHSKSSTAHSFSSITDTTSTWTRSHEIGEDRHGPLCECTAYVFSSYPAEYCSFNDEFT
jgi:hypothetical protein